VLLHTYKYMHMACTFTLISSQSTFFLNLHVQSVRVRGQRLHGIAATRLHIGVEVSLGSQLIPEVNRLLVFLLQLGVSLPQRDVRIGQFLNLLLQLLRFFKLLEMFLLLLLLLQLVFSVSSCVSEGVVEQKDEDSVAFVLLQKLLLLRLLGLKAYNISLGVQQLPDVTRLRCVFLLQLGVSLPQRGVRVGQFLYLFKLLQLFLFLTLLEMLLLLLLRLLGLEALNCEECPLQSTLSFGGFFSRLFQCQLNARPFFSQRIDLL